MVNKRIWNIAGLMSGTSLDGLDVALCRFSENETKLTSFEIVQAETFPYTDDEKRTLDLMHASASALAEAHFNFGRYCGEKVKEFLLTNQIQVDFISSHGHTVFHQPGVGFTAQIGSGAVISAITGLPVVSDFRSTDVALGGQGAPLVPVGDLMLFKEFKYCLNLGGIANISVKTEGGISAYDICPANMILNELAKEAGKEYDRGGAMAREGTFDQALFDQLNKLGFYNLPAPKSLGKEWFDQSFKTLTDSFPAEIKDKLNTCCEHIAEQIALQIKEPGKMLITGGGAFNTYLIERIAERTKGLCTVIVPDALTVNFKEALIFAFLGLLRIQNKPNALTSVTGARTDSSGGALYGDFRNLI